MKTRKAKWTRGPISTAEVVLYDDVKAEKEIDAEDQANVSLIAAAFNAATALEDQGYDGMETIKALPEIVEALRLVTYHYENVRAAEQYPTPDSTSTREARALLAQIKEEK